MKEVVFCKRCGGVRISMSGENWTKDHIECDKADSLERIVMLLEIIANQKEQTGFK
jgi:hypothetical protein